MLKLLRTSPRRRLFVSRPVTHDELFMSRYEQLLRKAMQMTGSRHQAEDIVHDAYVQFVLQRPDILAIHNLDSYLATVLRNTYISQLRREASRPMRNSSVLDFDSAELGFCALDPRGRIEAHLQAQDELRLICAYACSRKNEAKSSSILILRFFLGYYPGEIARLAGMSAQAVSESLRTAREEARGFLLSSQRSLMPERRGTSATAAGFLLELREQIFSSATDCLGDAALTAVFGPHSTARPETPALAHLVSCPRCLDWANKRLGLPLLAERFPDDGDGRNRPGGGSDDGAGGKRFAGGGGDDGDWGELDLKQAARRCQRRAKQIFEYRPDRLSVCVNGYEIASQLVASQLDETLSINLPEPVAFVEVFGANGLRLMLLNVTHLPEGDVVQSGKVDLSDGRSLTFSVDLSGAWPAVHLVYCDPALAPPVLDYASDSESHISPAAPAGSPEPRRLREILAGLLPNWPTWFRPALAGVASVLVTVAVLLMWSDRESKPQAGTLLNRSMAADMAIVRPGSVIHRSVALTERDGGGQVIARSRIEIWQGVGEKTARRVYNEKKQLDGGEWVKADGSRMLYQRGGKLHPGRVSKPLEALTNHQPWRVPLSAQTLRESVAGGELAVDEQPTTYVVRYENAERRPQATLIYAKLVVRRSDLHAVEQSFTIETNGEERSYDYIETELDRSPASAIIPAVFEPDPELANVPARPEMLPLSLARDLEIQLLDRLDRMDALTAEQLQVRRETNGEIVVKGQVATEQRRKTIIAGLGALAHGRPVTTAIVTVAETAARTRSQRSGPIMIEAVTGSDHPSLAARKARSYFTAIGFSGTALQSKVDEFTQEVLQASNRAKLEALTLKQVDSELTAAEVSALSTRARYQRARLLLRHSSGLQHEMETIQTLLAPVFGPDSTAPEASADVDTNTAVERVVDLSFAVDDAIWNSFSSPTENRGVTVEKKQFWEMLQRALASAAAINENTNREDHSIRKGHSGPYRST